MRFWVIFSVRYQNVQKNSEIFLVKVHKWDWQFSKLDKWAFKVCA